MAVLIFIIILAVLIVVHEFGHFIVAKKSGIKVTEFGVGFPPRIWSKKKGETLYSVNAIPFGGFVRIHGETPDEDSISGPDSARSILNKPRPIQIAVLVAGVTFNVLFAWILISFGFISGLPTPSSSYTGPGTIENVQTVITAVSPNSPALNAGVKAGDAILNISSGKYVAKEISPEIVSNFIEAHGKEGITLDLKRGDSMKTFDMKAEEGVVQGQIAIGIAMDTIGTLKLPLHQAFIEGAKVTFVQLESIALGLVTFFGKVFVGEGSLQEVTGPVGIVGLVGDVTHLGFTYLLSFTAIISLNLAVINLLPFPALDGGRIVIVLIESIIRKPLPVKFVNGMNALGFLFLIILMLVVTVHDVFKLI